MGRRNRIEAIAVLSNYGNRNLGDEATLAAILQQVRDRCDGVRLHAISFDPEDTEARHGVIALPAQRETGRRPGRPEGIGPAAAPGPRAERPAKALERHRSALRAAPLAGPLLRALRSAWTGSRGALAEAVFMLRSVRALRGIDCLLVGGGGQLSDDFGGTWAFPYLVLKWTVMARLAGARVLFASVGAGPLESRLARFFVGAALRLADHRSFRDDGSRALIATLGVDGPVYADPAWALRVEKVDAEPRPGSASLAVGLNPFPHEDARYWPGGQRARYEAYLDALAGFTEWLIARGHSVVLFPTQLKSDPRVIADLKARLATRAPALSNRVLERTVETVDDLVATISTLDLVVSGRFHGILLSFLLRKPVVGLSYQSKIDELMQGAGQGAYRLPAAGLETGALVERFEALEAARAGIGARLTEEADNRRGALESQFDTLFGAKRPRTTTAMPSGVKTA
jgi:polysaccharide pyruvyl transferase WcaK-like protein